MGTKYCLDKIQTNEFIELLCDAQKVDKTSTLYPFLDGYEAWDLKFIFLNYLWAQIIQKSIKKGCVQENLIEIIYEKKKLHSFDIEEFSAEYIEFIVSHISDPNKELEENLILLNDKFSDYDWRAKVRS